MLKLHPNERLLIEARVGHYRVVGPGLIWPLPWHIVLTKFDVGQKEKMIHLEDIRTVENIPINVTLLVRYKICTSLFYNDLLYRLPELNQAGWDNILQWRTEQIVQHWVADYSWKMLHQQSIQQRLERQLSQTLTEHLKRDGLSLRSISLVHTELPVKLQRTVVQTEQDGIEPSGRATVLKEYFDIFGHDLAHAMPYIIQWEILNTLHKQGNTHLLFTNMAQMLSGKPPQEASDPLGFQLKLPLELNSYS